MQDPTEKHFGDVGILDKYEVNNNNNNSQQFELSCRLNKNKAYVRKSIDRLFSYCKIFI